MWHPRIRLVPQIYLFTKTSDGVSCCVLQPLKWGERAASLTETELGAKRRKSERMGILPDQSFIVTVLLRSLRHLIKTVWWVQNSNKTFCNYLSLSRKSLKKTVRKVTTTQTHLGISSSVLIRHGDKEVFKSLYSSNSNDKFY